MTEVRVEAAVVKCVEEAFLHQGEVAVECGPVSRLAELAAEDMDVRARMMRATDVRGPVLISLEFMRGDSVVAHRLVSAAVRVFRDVAIAAEDLPRHVLIESGAVRLERRDIFAMGDRVFVSPIDLAGKRTRRIVSEGELILADDVEDIPLIERGDKVLLTVSLGGITVSATARALEGGAQGDLITVRNDRGGKRVQGTIVGEGRVWVTIDGLMNSGG